MKNEATINWENGQLVIDFTKKNYNKFYRNIIITKNDQNEILVTASKANYINSWNFYDILTREYDSELFELIDESYIIEEQIPIFGFLQIFLNFKPTKFKKIKTLKEKCPDWIECKETNIPYNFKTNNYLIIN